MILGSRHGLDGRTAGEGGSGADQTQGPRKFGAGARGRTEGMKEGGRMKGATRLKMRRVRLSTVPATGSRSPLMLMMMTMHSRLRSHPMPRDSPQAALA